MIGFLGKVLSNLLAMLMALGILVGGCVYLGNAAFKSAYEAQQRHAEQMAENNAMAPEREEVEADAHPAPIRERANPTRTIMEAAKTSFTDDVIRDLREQYEIVKRGSDEMAKAMRAGAVAEMYLQGKDQANYERWKATSDGHMKRALGQ